MKEWINSGKPWIWGTAGGLALALVMVFGVLWLTAARGLALAVLLGGLALQALP